MCVVILCCCGGGFLSSSSSLLCGGGGFCRRCRCCGGGGGGVTVLFLRGLCKEKHMVKFLRDFEYVSVLFQSQQLNQINIYLPGQ